MLWIADRSFGGGVEVHWWGRGLGGNRAPLRRTVGVRPIALIECLCMETTALSPTHCHTTPNQDAVPISYRAKTNAEWTTAEAIAPRRKLQTTVAAPQVRCGCLRIGHRCNHQLQPSASATLTHRCVACALVDCTSAAAPPPVYRTSGPGCALRALPAVAPALRPVQHRFAVPSARAQLPRYLS